jgi:hypothetical protein
VRCNAHRAVHAAPCAARALCRPSRHDASSPRRPMRRRALRTRKGNAGRGHRGGGWGVGVVAYEAPATGTAGGGVGVCEIVQHERWSSRGVHVDVRTARKRERSMSARTTRAKGWVVPWARGCAVLGSKGVLNFTRRVLMTLIQCCWQASQSHL